MVDWLFAFLLAVFQVGTPDAWLSVGKQVVAWLWAYAKQHVLQAWQKPPARQAHPPATPVPAPVSNPASATPGKDVTVIVPPGTEVTIIVRALPGGAA